VPESSNYRVHIFFPCVIYAQYPFIMSPNYFLCLVLSSMRQCPLRPPRHKSNIYK
jgi:hypothetical protein